MSTAKASTPDLVILGAGAAGMLAALAAGARGMRVTLVDPHYSGENNLWISGGLVPMAGSRLQRAAGIDDSPERWLADLRAFAPDSINERIAGAVAHAMPEVLDFLLDRCGAPLRFLPDVAGPGHSAPRFHSLTPASGKAWHAWLRGAVQAMPAITCIADTPLESVERRSSGYEIAWRGHAPGRVQTPLLLLAGGGFGADAAMVAEFIPEMNGAVYSGTPTNDGTVITLARRWNAALAGMDGYQGQGHTNPGPHTRLGMSLPTLGAILINRDGHRFVHEDVGPSGLAAHVLAQPGRVALEIFDREIEDQLTNHIAYQEARAAGVVLEADTIEGLAAAAGMPAERVAAALAEADRYATGEATDPLGRRAFVKRLRPPYRASWVTGSLAHTQGGVVTDDHGQVLDTRGMPIRGLYAAGGSAAGLSGRGGEGYLPGNGLAQSFGLAFLAVRRMAAA